MSAAPVGTREISRHAVRAELARVAFNRFCLTGFNQVTFTDLSEAAGVSRSTFLRYFGTKEDVVLFVFDPVGDVITDALDAERANQDDWSRLRNALESAVRFLVRDVQELVTILGLIEQTPALCAASARSRLNGDQRSSPDCRRQPPRPTGHRSSPTYA